jgi:altronate dehydratase large subunit
MEFMGYVRQDGSVGVRNYIGVISTAVCGNEVTARIARQIEGSVNFLHAQGCGHSAPDLEQVTRTLINLGRNPNLGGVLVVSLGCETVDPDAIVEGIAKSGKPVEKVVARDAGGSLPGQAHGGLIAQRLAQEVTGASREPVDVSELVLGVKCGASDTTSGLGSNPVTGVAADLLIENGGTAIIGETPEFMGAEHILARRCVNEEVREKLLHFVDRFEKRILAHGVDMRGGNPSAVNIKGGITSIEEKSLGAIRKGGSTTIMGVHDYGERIRGKGLHTSDTPGREPEVLTGLAAAGAQVIVFSTGQGTPHGFPFVPVIKVTGNANTYERLRDYIDVGVHQVIEGTENLKSAGKRVFDELLEVASGKRTKAEIIGYTDAMNIYVTGPTL